MAGCARGLWPSHRPHERWAELQPHAVCDDAGRPVIFLLTERQMSDHKGPALSIQCCPTPRRLLPTRAMIVMHSERLSPNAASRLAFHREPSAVCPQHTARLRIDTQGREHVRKAKRLAAYLNALRPLRPHILQRYLHRGNRYLLARSMSPDPSVENGC